MNVTGEPFAAKLGASPAARNAAILFNDDLTGGMLGSGLAKVITINATGIMVKEYMAVGVGCFLVK